MVKKISFLILSAAIMVIGIIAFGRLSYWDRSVSIFRFSSDAPFEGRMGRSHGGGEFEEREGPGGREGFARPDIRNLPDSLGQQLGPRNGERTGRGPVEEGMRNGEDHERGELSGREKINIRNVKWFLAVFASFTVIVIYIDKAICFIRRRKGRQVTIKEIM